MNSISPARALWLLFRVGLGGFVVISCGFIAWAGAMGAATTHDFLGRLTLCVVALFFLVATYAVFRILIYRGGEFRVGSVLPVLAGLLAVLFTLGALSSADWQGRCLFGGGALAFTAATCALIWLSHTGRRHHGGGRPPGGGAGSAALAPIVPGGSNPPLSAASEYPTN
jgi:hypothetical protein